MKGDARVLEALNEGLALELTAVNQYFLQARMLSNWGYHKLGQKLFDESLDEMTHAQKIMDRILLLEGSPQMAPRKVQIGGNVKAMLDNDLTLESQGAKAYNAAIELCLQAKDAASRELLEDILVDSEHHVNWIESQVRLVQEVGIENYLADQIGEEKTKGK